MKKEIVFQEVKFFSGCVIASLALTYVMCPYCRTNATSFGVTFAFCLSMWVLLWRGNSWIAHFLNEKFSWLDQPAQRFAYGILGTIIYTGGIVSLILYVFRVWLHFDLGKSLDITIIITVILTVFISLFLHSREFFLNWRKLELDAVQLRNENLSSKYESLKSQLDPHFLFNSLNVLTNLVYQDADKSAKFIKQLSEVYRYVLEVRTKELVPLADELKFVDAYLFLQTIRFGDKLIIENELKGKDGLIPPLALQLLVENAIKHNVVAEDYPLTIKLYQQGWFIVVENNLQKKEMQQPEAVGIGLENIRKRYEFLTNKQIVVEENGLTFIVRLPVIENNEV